MKKLLFLLLVVAALLMGLRSWQQAPAVVQPVAAVPIIRKHLPELHKHVSRVPAPLEHPHQRGLHAP